MATPNILRNHSVQHAQPPFSNSQVSETATHREILNIYQHARPETIYYYDMGRDTQGLEEENWVIRWLLWHVFRYRDNRNKNRRQGSPDPRSPSSSENSSSESQTPASNGMFAIPVMAPTSRLRSFAGGDGDWSGSSSILKGFYDPVRDNGRSC
jgi:hypothetical protein